MRFRDLAIAYMKSGLYSFSAAANEVLHEQLVEKRSYLTDTEYVRMMSMGALVPGPFHVNLVIATGYAIAGARGAVLAVASFVLPGFLIAVVVVSALNRLLSTGLSAKCDSIAAGMLSAVAGLVVAVVVKLVRANRLTPIDKIGALAITGLLIYAQLPFVFVVLATGAIFFLVELAGLRRCN